MNVEQMLIEYIRTSEGSLDPRLWIKLVEEEKKELDNAIENEGREEVLKELTDLMYVTIGFNIVASGPEQLGLFSKDEHKKLLEILEDASKSHSRGQTVVGECNWYEAFKRVHENNMGRMFQEDGSIKRRKDGKIIKNRKYPKVKLGDLLPSPEETAKQRLQKALQDADT